MKRLARLLLRLWRRLGRKAGWHYRLVEALGPSLAAAAPLASQLPNGAVVACDLREQIPRLIFFLGVYEPPEAFFFHRLLRPGWTVVDVGANLGQYSLLAAAAVTAAGQVHSFEPVPASAALLRQNLARNGFAQVQVTEAALWHRTGQLELSLEPQNAFVSGGYSVGVQSGIAPVRAAALVFDDYARAQALPRLDLVKMDIEGAEYFALLGMKESLARFRPLLQMEVARPYAERLGYQLDDIWNLLVRELGYRALLLGESAVECVPLASFSGIIQRNVLFHPAALPPDLLDGWDRAAVRRWSCGGWSRRPSLSSRS